MDAFGITLYYASLIFAALFVGKMIWLAWVVLSGEYDDSDFDDDMPTGGWG